LWKKVFSNKIFLLE